MMHIIIFICMCTASLYIYFILVDDQFSVIACYLVSSISPAVKVALHQKLSCESLTTFIKLVIDCGLQDQ